MGDWLIELLDENKHERALFDCGEEDLNSYLQQKAARYAEKNISVTYVATREGDCGVIGFCAVAATSVERADLNDSFRRRAGRYKQVPAMIIGQLAVRRADTSQGVGWSLVAYALRLAESISRQIGVALVILDARDDKLIQYYERYGFRELTRVPRRMFISTREIRNILDARRRARPS